MEKSSAPGSSFGESDATPDAAGGPPVVGDADAVQKTTWVVGKGTNPNDRDDVAERTPGLTPSGEATRPMPRGTDGAQP